MHPATRILAVFSFSTLFALAAAGQDSAGNAEASLKNASGAPIGTATFSSVRSGSLVRVEADGLTPGWHGIHLHQAGDCSDQASGFKKSGGHHASMHSDHGVIKTSAPHTGDLPNIHAGKDGRAAAEFFSPAAVSDLLAGDGSALVIHAKADDYRSQPAGDSGDRIACGELRAAKP